jgi:L1 cell adhesion molecule like protein
LSSNDKEKIEDEVRQVLKWLEGNTLAEREEYDDKLQELQRICSPIMAKLHGSIIKYIIHYNLYCFRVYYE